MNTSENVTLSTSIATPTPSGPSLLTIILMAISAWIIVANMAILFFLISSRKALKNFVNLQILSLCVTDILVGLSAIPTSLTYKLAVSLLYFEPCAAVLCSYSVAQAATLYHAFVICIHRLITTKRCTGRSETNPRNMYKTLLAQISIPWIEGIVIVSLPFLIYGEFGKRLPGCSLNTVFEENYISAMTIICINLIVPQIGMNVAYIYMLVFLQRQWRRVGILRDNARPHATTSDGVWNTSRVSASLETTKLTTATVGADKSALTSEIQDGTNVYDPKLKTTVDLRNINENADCNRLTDDVGAGQSRSCDKGINATWKNNTDDNNCNLTGTISTKTNKIEEANRPLKSKGPKLGISGQRDVVITIGLLLVILNVFMTPLTLLVLFESLNVQLLNRQVKFIIMVFALMNSALNPCVYIARIKPFRKAVKDMWMKCFSKICR